MPPHARILILEIIADEENHASFSKLMIPDDGLHGRRKRVYTEGIRGTSSAGRAQAEQGHSDYCTDQYH